MAEQFRVRRWNQPFDVMGTCQESNLKPFYFDIWSRDMMLSIHPITSRKTTHRPYSRPIESRYRDQSNSLNLFISIRWTHKMDPMLFGLWNLSIWSIVINQSCIEWTMCCDHHHVIWSLYLSLSQDSRQSDGLYPLQILLSDDFECVWYFEFLFWRCFCALSRP